MVSFFSCEIVSVLAVALKVNHILGRFGLFRTILFASLVRSVAVFGLGLSSNILFWCFSVIFLGISTYLVLISLQTWINCLDLGHLRGLIVGLYSSALSLGTALGPIAAGSIGVDGTSIPFGISSTLMLSVILIVLPLVRAVPRFRADSVPRIFYAIKMAKVPMFSSLVGGITFYGLPAFSSVWHREWIWSFSGIDFVDVIHGGRSSSAPLFHHWLRSLIARSST